MDWLHYLLISVIITIILINNISSIRKYYYPWFFSLSKKIVGSNKSHWKNTNLPSLKGESIDTSNLLARYKEEGNQEPLKVLNNGDCQSIGILPLVIIGAGIAVGAGGSGSGTSSSN